LPACRTLQAALEPDGSPLFIWKPLAACRRFEPRKHSRTLALTHPGIPSSPLRDRVDCFNHDRFRGYGTVHFRSGLLPSCLRFAVYVTGHHARLGARLLARLCRGRHLRRLSSIRLQGATLADPDVQISRFRFFMEELCSRRCSTPSVTRWSRKSFLPVQLSVVVSWTGL